MHTPSLRRRLVVSTLLVVVTTIVLLEVFVYLRLQRHLEAALDTVVETRLETALQLAAELGPQELGARLTEAGVPAVIRPEGQPSIQADPEVGRLQILPPGQATTLVPPYETRTGPLTQGGEVTVFVSRAGIDGTLRRLVLLEVAGSAAILAVSALVLRRTAGVVLEPLDQVVEVARGTAAGQGGRRLHPDDPATELGQMATAFDAMLDHLESALEDAQEAEARTRDFLAEAAHQLRTPTAAIRATVETLLLDPDEPEREALLAALGRESAHAGRLVAALLRQAELDSGWERAPRPVDLAEVVEDAAESLRRHAPRLRVVVEGEPTTVPIDPDAVGEALTNLLDNARRFARTRVTVSVRPTAEGARVSVSDDGPGIAAADRDRVFDRFVSLDGSGSGLGLSIARAIVEGHDGRLVATDVGFELTLPG